MHIEVTIPENEAKKAAERITAVVNQLSTGNGSPEQIAAVCRIAIEDVHRAMNLAFKEGRAYQERNPGQNKTPQHDAA